MKMFNIINTFALNAGENAEKISQDILIDPSRFLGTLKHMGIGMLSIFLVIGVIILAVYALNKTTAAIEERKAQKENNEQ